MNCQGSTQQQTEATLRAREAELARVQRIGRIGGFEIDLRGGQFRNRRSPEYLEVHGLPSDAAEEAHEAWVRRLHPDDRIAAEAHFKNTVAGTARHYESEYRIVVSEGVRWISAVAEIERDVDGAPLRMIGVHIDITRTKEAEEALRASEARLRQVLAAIGEAFYALDREERFVIVSRRALEMWGLAEAAVIGRPIEAVFPGVSAGQTYQVVRQALHAGRPGHAEGPSVSLHGRWIEQDAFPTADGGVAVSFRDIHDRKQTELALRQSEARFRAAVAAVSGIVWSTDAAGRMQGEQTGWAALTGQAPGAYRGFGWIDAVHEEDREATLAAWREAVARGSTFTWEHRLRRADGTLRLFAVRAVPVAGVAMADVTGGIREWVGVHTDITTDRAVRDELARLNGTLEARVRQEVAAREAALARLVEAQRMQALGQLAGGIAHDVNNVLQAIQGGAALIARRPHDTEAVRRLAAMMREATERGSSVTRRLLAFSRRDELRAAPLDAAALLVGLQEMLRHTLGGGIAVEAEIAQGLPALLADKGQLETVLVNLATNARDAMPKGGTLTMSAAAEDVTGDGELPDATYVRIAVRDTGTGMDPETLGHATEPFFSTKPAGQGTGLGLAMARGFAQQSGGALHIASTPGAGTVVTLWFPASPEAPAAAAPEVASTTGAGAAVLLVDDDALVRQALVGELEAEGYRVEALASGPEALAALEGGSACDALVTDLSMPGLDGLALIAAARQIRPRLPAILLTGFATEETGLAVGGTFTVLRKPVSGKALAERIAVVLEGGIR